ncbi:MAG: hypothetical protein GOP50_07140 [Candidatus Heimdallarchaeota archaeon]|nr:hypothetical protein [Candidatus Heimdallarchaeota archaeon]
MIQLSEFKQLSKEMAHIPIYLKEITKKSLLEHPLFFHLSKYPLLQCRDVYKFIYQGSCGWAHLTKLGDEKHVKNYLVKELSEAVDPVEIDEIFELLDKETRIGRVNLRSWKAQVGEDLDLLWELMIKAKQNTPETTELFIQRWGEFSDWIEQGIIMYPLGAEKSMKKWLVLISEIAQKVELAVELPLVSHSPMYRKSYNPTYRLVREEDIFKKK